MFIEAVDRFSFDVVGVFPLRMRLEIALDACSITACKHK
jgi:hypothetical protein